MATNPFDQFDGPVYGAPDPGEARANRTESRQEAQFGLDQQRFAYQQQQDALAAQAKADEAAQKAQKFEAARSNSIANLTDVINKIDAVGNQARSGWFDTGRGGAFVRGLPNAVSAGTDAYNLQANLGKIDATGAFSTLQAMREASPTGGALGAVSDTELGLLKSSVANLDPNQSEDQFLSNLGEARNVYLRMLERLDPEAAAALRAQESETPPAIDDENGLQVTVTDTSPNAPPAPPSGGGPVDPTGGRSDIATLARQGITLGLSDEAAGIGGYLSGFLTGEDPSAAYTRERDAERGRIATARQNSPVLGTLAEFLGGGGAARIAQVPNALAGVVRQGAALGGVGGFGYGEGSTGSVGNALAGAAGGGVLGAGLYGLGAGARSLAGRFGSQATPEQQAIIQAGEREGVRVMTSDVRPPTSFTGQAARAVGERIPIAGTGSTRAAQQGERVNAVRNVLEEFGAANADDAVNAVSRDLVATRGAEIGRLTKQKNSIISGIGGAVPAPKAIGAIDQQITKLNGINEEAFAPVVSRLQNFRDELAAGKTLEQVEGNRKLLGDLFKDPNLSSISGDGQKALNAIYGPLREDMGAFIRQNGGTAQFNRWKQANDKLAAMAGELDATAFKSLLNKADTTPESAARIIFGKTASDMKKVYGSLSEAGKAKAQSAILYKAAEGSVDGDSISPQKFANALKALDKATGVFFSSADKARLDGLEKLLRTTQRASEASALPPTGVQNTQMLGGYTLGSMFGAGALPVAGGLGLLARAYESQPVRNALLRLGRTSANSPQAGRAMDAVRNALARFAANDNGAQAFMRSPAAGVAAREQDEDVRSEPVQ